MRMVCAERFGFGRGPRRLIEFCRVHLRMSEHCEFGTFHGSSMRQTLKDLRFVIAQLL